jgi:hypothetical protein
MSRVRAALFLALLVPCRAAGDDATKLDYQKEADNAAWQWAPERASALDSLTRYDGDYEVAIVRKPGRVGVLTIEVRADGKPVYSWEGYAGSVFAGKGGVIYRAHFHPSASGCDVIAYDLRARKEVWKTHLRGLGPIAHFRYRNAVTLDLRDGVLVVHGKESAGNYIEYVDTRTGKTVGHKSFRNR